MTEDLTSIKNALKFIITEMRDAELSEAECAVVNSHEYQNITTKNRVDPVKKKYAKVLNDFKTTKKSCDPHNCWYLETLRKDERKGLFELLKNIKTEADGLECVMWNDIEHIFGETT